MKPEIHPTYEDVKVTCSCGSTFVTRSTLGRDSLLLEVCAACHPFYTGTQKIVDTAGRVDRFRQKYAKKPVVAAPKADATTEAKTEVKKSEAKKADTKKSAKKAEDKK